MGYFEGVTEGLFKRDRAGNTVFYPWGVFGKGRILPSEEAAHNARTFVRRYHSVSLPMILVLSLLGGWRILLLVAPLFMLWFYIGCKRLVVGAPFSSDKLLLSEAYANSAAHYSRGFLRLGQIVLWLNAPMCIWLAVTLQSNDHKRFLILFALLSAAGGAFMTYMLRLQDRRTTR